MIETKKLSGLTYREYPGFGQKELESDIAHHLENLEILGYSIMPNVISSARAAEIAELLQRLYQKQDDEFGVERLKQLNDYEVHRGLLMEDEIFLQMAAEPQILEVVHAVLGKSAILNLQNASCAKPGSKHYQSAWHRDFAKDFVASKCLSVNAFWCIDDFSPQNGATWLLPYSHKLEEFPSEKFIKDNGIQLAVPSGSVVFWDSLLLHQAGFNSTEKPRFGINHMYTRPFIKQQIDFPEYLKSRVDIESPMGQLMGFWSIPPKSVKEFRVDPDKRTYRSGQG